MPRKIRVSKENCAEVNRPSSASTEDYRYPTAELALRPEVGTQARFRSKKPPVTYRYDSSLSPAMDWDGQNGARELGEWLLSCVEDASRLPAPHEFSPVRDFKVATGETIVSVRGLVDAVDQLRRVGRPFLDWAGKAERSSFEIPTLPLFIHERLSTKVIIETLTGHTKNKQLDLFGSAGHSIADQILRAYEYKDNWVNRLVLGDSLVVMNSLLHYEGLGAQVQMVFMDPPYGVSFGSNFQPFVRKRDVSHNDDSQLTREPEMVQAYRDTWELGLHSYLTYMRDRLLLAHELLHPSGSIFVQISDENIHHVRELMDEVFGPENFVVVVCYRRLGMMVGETIQSSAHYLLWYARDRQRMKCRKVFERQEAGVGSGDHYTQIENLNTGEVRPMTREEIASPSMLGAEWKPFQLVSLTTGGFRPNTTIDYAFDGQTYHPGPNKCWRTTREGLDRLASSRRIVRAGNTLRYKQFLDDFPWMEVTTIWDDTARDPVNFYVVQTPSNIVRRCLLMTTDPGDLVFDPTCGSGTTAYVAEQWGRRWIVNDVSRVPLALTRQRLLTATFPFHELKDPEMGPAGGFVYKRRRNNKGEDVGGIVPHVTLKSIANSEAPTEEVLVDRPEQLSRTTRVSGPFCMEATIPTPVDWEGDGVGDSGLCASVAQGAFTDRLVEVLRRSPLLHLSAGRKVALKNVRRPPKTLSLSAEAVVENGVEAPVAFVFGPENGAVSEQLIYNGACEARDKKYTHLYVVGFAIQPNARAFVEKCENAIGIPATYVQATPDLLMGDLLKNMRSSQIFSVCGLPEIKIAKKQTLEGTPGYQVELVGFDLFDPIEMKTDHRKGSDVPAWFLDTDYNGLCFHVCQAFFPRTSAWDHLRRALKATHEETVWDHLAGTVSGVFQPGEHGQVAVKVIDDRGNELLVVKPLTEARA